MRFFMLCAWHSFYFHHSPSLCVFFQLSFGYLIINHSCIYFPPPSAALKLFLPPNVSFMHCLHLDWTFHVASTLTHSPDGWTDSNCCFVSSYVVDDAYPWVPSLLSSSRVEQLLLSAQQGYWLTDQMARLIILDSRDLLRTYVQSVMKYGLVEAEEVKWMIVMSATLPFPDLGVRWL